MEENNDSSLTHTIQALSHTKMWPNIPLNNNNKNTHN